MGPMPAAERRIGALGSTKAAALAAARKSGTWPSIKGWHFTLSSQRTLHREANRLIIEPPAKNLAPRPSLVWGGRNTRSAGARYKLHFQHIFSAHLTLGSTQLFQNPGQRTCLGALPSLASSLGVRQRYVSIGLAPLVGSWGAWEGSDCVAHAC